MTIPQRSGALAGVVVLDLSRVLAGPYCTEILADFGATVIKIENPRDPDVTRGFPPYLRDGEDELSGYFAQYNRGKLTMTLDLAVAEGTQALGDLVERADILVENFRPGTMDKLGVGYDVLSKRNPRLVYTAISGYGQTGGNRRKPAFDSTAQAAGGLWSMNGAPGDVPVRVGTVIGDLAATLYAVSGTLIALRHAERTGVGQLVDVAQVDSVIALTENAVVNYTIDGEVATNTGNAHPWVRPYELFPCADGFVFFAGYTDKFWRLACELFGSTGLIDDPEIDTMRKRFDAEVYDRKVRPAILAWFAGRTKAELEAIAGEELPLTAIKDIREVVEAPGTTEREMVVDVEHEGFGAIRMFGQPVKLSATPADTSHPSGRLGEHTDLVLGALAGYDTDRIELLRAAGAV